MYFTQTMDYDLHRQKKIRETIVTNAALKFDIRGMAHFDVADTNISTPNKTIMEYKTANEKVTVRETRRNEKSQ